MPPSAPRLGARLRSFALDDPSTRQGLVALLVCSLGNLLAGLSLGAITGTLEELPGLLVLVPAAIGMRGNIFGALGSRLGTAIHTGTFQLTRRPQTVVGQNVLASLALTLSISLALALLAKGVSVGFGLRHTISIADFVVISMVGGAVSSVVVLVITLLIAAGSVRFGWDMDSVAAPLVTAAGDVVTLPALFLATFLTGIDWLTPVLAGLTAAAAVAALVAAIRSPLALLARIVRESMPVLVVAGTVDVVAGLTIEKRLESFVAFPALLVLIPPFLEDLGALGGILSSKVSSKLHLGIAAPTPIPGRSVRGDLLLTFVYALPVFVVVSLAADLAAGVSGLATPGPARMLALTVFSGMLATVAAVAVAYYSSVAAFRLGLDPDNHGIPIVTSSMDLVGAFALILGIVAFGFA